MEKTNKLPIFVAHWFATPMRGKQLKGNQVQVLNSPAAVSSIQVTSNSLIATGDQSGKAFVTGISQKTYHANKFHCFRGKSVESNEPDKSSIISFITLIQRKCVKTDKLCQVYLCVSGRSDLCSIQLPILIHTTFCTTAKGRYDTYIFYSRNNSIRYLPDPRNTLNRSPASLLQRRPEKPARPASLRRGETLCRSDRKRLRRYRRTENSIHTKPGSPTYRCRL